MTETFAKKLGLPMKKCHVPIGALNALSTVARHTITATIHSRVGGYQRTLTFLVIPTISTTIPDRPIDRAHINIPRNVKLADPNFNRPAPVEMLLSAGVALSLLCIGQINLSSSDGPDLYLQKTRLGWVIGGSVPSSPTSAADVCHATTALQHDISRFWEIEEGPQTQHLSESDAACEKQFQDRTYRNQKGRYVVSLPFNENIIQLGKSRGQATQRLVSLERKLRRDPELQRQYSDVIQEYLDLGHMSECSHKSLLEEGFYLPHHGVLKSSSETTKLRVVFDGSAPTTTGVSLNDALHTGPKIQDDLLDILLRFRIHQFVITGDIEKMYRQFIVRKEDRKFQRILWRNAQGQIRTYELNTVTFGLSAAPFLAIRCLNQLAHDEGHRFPEAAAILQRDFYVDDALTGAATRDQALRLRKDLTQLLKLAGLTIRQWASNDRRLLHDLPVEQINKKLHLGESSTVKTLGIMWNSIDDSISYSVKTTQSPTHITKRHISSEIAKIYDPLGLLGPVIVRAKLMLQKIWTMKVDWDESLQSSIHNEWIQFYSQLPLLNNIKFQRKTVVKTSTEVQLHGFCDASEKAYGACIYLRTTNSQGHTESHLLVAKSKVAPLKQHTIPRLELCGALLLTSLITMVQKALHIQVNRIVLWTDSSIVLHWLNTSPHILKTFVANRVSEIQTKSKIENWRHVPTHDNPADLISRGLSPEDFLQPSIWQHGPHWLVREEYDWPNRSFLVTKEIPEQKQSTCLATTTIDTSILDRYSSWCKLVRIIAVCLRWKRENRRVGSLTTCELNNAHNTIIRVIQQAHFSGEIRDLTKDRNATINGKLQRLNPFIDKDGILRVGGRLKHSAMPFSQKHAIILPKSHVTSIIIENHHISHLHAGVQATLYAVRQRYWPIDGRSQVWQVVRRCIRCCRAQPPSIDYIMGNLPESRVTESRPFTNTGVDYCGPFYIKERRHRNRTRIKVYVAVFVCFAVKAVHLELVSDLSTEAFLAALRRFIARRGFCSNLYSDNGTNFVGANNQLQELKILLQSSEHHQRIREYLSTKSIQWHFIPPQSPHFGGLWEAAVKSFKYHLKRVAGTDLFTFENFNTLIIEIEAVLNSRPLTPISADPNDLQVLTPGHFLVGDALTSPGERDFRDIPSNRLSSWQHIQKIKQDFWKRWHREYLNELATRSKWTKGGQPLLKEGTIVLLRDDNLPSMQWALGRIIKVHPGSDGIVRTVTLQTATSVLDRSVKKVVPLPNQDDPTSRDSS